MTFIPEQPEETIMVKVTKREAILLARLRKYRYGKFTIDKVNGQIMRLVSYESIAINTEDTVELT